MRTLPHKKHKAGSGLNQVGMASILVTMVMMIVISLIVIGFAQVSRRNQREAIDNQLSSQAFYAAETGVNDYAKQIKAYLAANPNPRIAKLTQSNCTPAGGNIYMTTNKVPSSPTYGYLSGPPFGTGPDVQYTCVLVNPSPSSLQYSSVGDAALIIPITAASNISKLVLSWQTTQPAAVNPNPANGCPVLANIDQFPDSSAWNASNCGLGLLRIDLVPTSGPQTDQNLQANAMTAYLVPTRPPAALGSGTVSYTGSGNNQYSGPTSQANQGAVVAASCTNAAGCSMTITSLSGTNYFLRVSSIYQTSALQVQAYGASPTPLPLFGTQMEIDATGKAQDVLRRIQVRLSNNPNSDTFDAAIQSSLPLCKMFQTYPGFAGDISGATGCTPFP